MARDFNLRTPSGAADVFGNDCALKSRVALAMADAFSLFGYNEIQTPTFEYCDVFGDDLSIPARGVMKFIDSEGSVMALRPDITTSICRAVAAHMKNTPSPLRLRYCGNAFRQGESYYGARGQEFTQSGVELFGSSSPSADAEVIALTINALLAAGLDTFQIELGQVDFLGGIIEECGLNETDAAALRSLIDKKYTLGIEEFCVQKSVAGALRTLLCETPNLFGDKSVAETLLEQPLNQKSRGALLNLLDVCGRVEEYGCGEYISVDLGLVRSFPYYTGVVFKGITHAMAFPICGGGRYDTLGNRFGMSIPATGSAIWVDRVASALSRHKNGDIELRADEAVGYCLEKRAAALLYAARRRDEGLRVVLDTEPSERAEFETRVKKCALRGVYFGKEGA
ncbi:MAG: ATP phosphoribosyltransferase regulatory subunit [Clostridia bacterium]|nr:ATP phosphoribosyltransferase regulatory subunit [Clostridia bacterium]